MRRLLPIVVSLLGLLSSALAQKPAAEVAKLGILLGKWESHETSTGRDGKKTQFTLHGANTWALDGRYLQIDESFEIEGAGKFRNLILIGYDPGAKLYRAWWYTNSLPTPLVFEGAYEGTHLVLTSQADKGKPQFRINYDFLEDGHYRASLEMKQADSWTTATVAEYRRTSKPGD